eukprot:TRINITY_DN5247_c0_g1_i1.p1 TRINITY_DN5247_c0_g1~~TRINITY_DN5247_c0_g1_i1.p1  ORF type:complete len:292 (-),score=31.42 TRINITY_DN5247_c0_g1_i1:20-895(-)
MRLILEVVVLLGSLVWIDCVTYTISASDSSQSALLQSTVDKCSPGDTILLQPGSHYLDLTVQLTIPNTTLKSDPGAVIRKSGTVSCIDLRAPYTTIDSIEIDGGDRPEPCMRVFSSNNLILNSLFHNSANTGLLVHYSNLNHIQGCKFYYNSMVGISQYASSDNEISWCQMYENGAEGLTIDVGSHNCMVHDNWIHMNNLVHHGVGGIGIDGSNGAWIWNNTIDWNGFDGVKFQNNVGGCDGVRIYDNPNISFNEGCAVKQRLTFPVTHLGMWDNNWVGNKEFNGLCTVNQ